MYREDYLELLNERKLEKIPVVLTPAEAMDILGVGKNTIYRLLNSGQLQGVRVGRCWRIELTSLQELFVYHQVNHHRSREYHCHCD